MPRNSKKTQGKPKHNSKFIPAPCTPTMEPQQFLSIMSKLIIYNKPLVDLVFANKTRSSQLKHPKSRHYATGIHTSFKCPTPMVYRSGWENIVAHFFDVADEVLMYMYEPFPITYFVVDKRTKKTKVKKYYPDFIVVFNDYSIRVVEVKRTDKITDRKVVQKTTAAEKWAKNLKIDYDVWQEKHVKMCKAHIANKQKTNNSTQT